MFKSYLCCVLFETSWYTVEDWTSFLHMRYNCDPSWSCKIASASRRFPSPTAVMFVLPSTKDWHRVLLAVRTAQGLAVDTPELIIPRVTKTNRPRFVPTYSIYLTIYPNLSLHAFITALVATGNPHHVLLNFWSTLAEDELNKSSVIKSPTKGSRNRNGSTTEMAVDQLQASEKLIAGKLAQRQSLDAIAWLNNPN